MKTPDNPWKRYGVSDDRWRQIFIINQILAAIGCVMLTVGLFLGEEEQYIHDIGTFLLLLALLPMIAGNKSEDEDEYDKIARMGMMVFILLALFGIPVAYLIKLIWF